ncbi:hypothetical protein N7532_001548 [Penicillium argentinense]|uniref:FAD-binding domain-containing protein n=1 Tax=Penicillium argentinense TaxID=1131581 RepID=A0A9W9KMJ6_9EURO|nr:uncharacterized protein N7532_001548 [Penicillium argentinense]KAJ5111013.1 hypothetical protein N7532_001548 [Penicillium argentinense]
MSQLDVLIVGAGPTGLVLALWLQKQGVNVRIIDKASGPATNSRALVVHARILELYRQIDLADELLSHGYKLPATNVWVDGHQRAHIPLREFGIEMTPYPFILSIPQDEHERILERRLNSHGIFVERRTSLKNFVNGELGVVATLVNEDTGIESTCESAYIVGCDGAHSVVRHGIGAKYEGDTYVPLFYIADLEAEEQESPFFNGEAHLTFVDDTFNLIVPYAQERRIRLIGTTIPRTNEPEADQSDHPEITFEDVLPDIKKASKLEIKQVNWFSTYRSHHRIAEKFRSNRAFLVGDAAHIHSPVGGQGMNTGIMDAINLAWKLATVVKQPSIGEGARNQLLDSYESERRSFALSVVGATDHGFKTITTPGFLPHILRAWIIPYIVPLVTKIQSVRSEIFRRGSQLVCCYRGSPISRCIGNGGTVQSGDRLPWAKTEDSDNFSSLSGISWQAHVYGDEQPALTEWCKGKNVQLHVFEWDQRHAQIGLRKDATYLLRPDHYIAGVFEGEEVEAQLEEYLSSHEFCINA